MSNLSKRRRWEHANDRNKISMDSDIDLSPFRQLVRDAEAWPVLSAEDERRLARDLRDGAPRARVGKSWRYASGPWTAAALEARERLVNCNIRLVISIAKRYNGASMDICDFIQAGTIGLMAAIERFDVDRGHKLSTHATFWIRQAISRAWADEDAHIRMPVYMVTQVLAAAQVGEPLDVPREPLRFSMALAPGQRFDDELTVGDRAEGQAAYDLDAVDDAVADGEMRSRLMPVLAQCLTQRERVIIRLRYGLGTLYGAPIKPHTLEAIGKVLGITRERVRQIEAPALKKLRKALADDGEGGFRVRPHAVASTAETEHTEQAAMFQDDVVA